MNHKTASTTFVKGVRLLACVTSVGWLILYTRLIPRATDVTLVMEKAVTSAISTEMALARARMMFEQLPLDFIENQGQIDHYVAYYVQGRDMHLYFTSQGVTFVFTGIPTQPSDFGVTPYLSSMREEHRGERRWITKLEFLGADPSVRPVGYNRTSAVISYFKGSREQWQIGLPTYSKVIYADLWPGIDLIYTGTANQLKYTFIVKPGADPNQIQLAYRGATKVMLNITGQLEVSTPVGGFTDDKPYVYQEMGGRRVEVDATYTLESRTDEDMYIYGFQIGAYDASRPLVLDPTMLVYAGYIGGSGEDWGDSIALDRDGNAYVTGWTDSSEVSFPEIVGPDLTYNGGVADAFVAKVNAAGTALVYAGYIGGSGEDGGAGHGSGIALDRDGNAYVTGRTDSSEVSFPEIVGPDLTYNGGVADAFVAKVNAAGTALVYAGYIGGADWDGGHDIALDNSGSAFVTGHTGSTEASFPEIVGPDLTYNYGLFDAFVAKVTTDGTALIYAGYIGGGGEDQADDIAVDNNGNAYITGATSSEEGFPVTSWPDLTYNGGRFDAFVAKVTTDGTALVFAGYIGGADEEVGHQIAVDELGNVYVTGHTGSTEASFPEIVGPDLSYNGGRFDAFVAKITTGNSPPGSLFLPLILKNSVQYFEGPWEVEDNDSASQANGPLRSSKDYYGHHDDASDYFFFHHSGGGLITIHMDTAAADAQLLLYYQSTTSLMGHRGGPPYYITCPSVTYPTCGATGTYYIRIFTGEGSINPDVSYTLRVTYP